MCSILSLLGCHEEKHSWHPADEAANVRGAGGVGGGLADNELLSASLGNELPPNRAHLVGIVDLDLLPGKPEREDFPGTLRQGGLLQSHTQERTAFPRLLGSIRVYLVVVEIHIVDCHMHPGEPCPQNLVLSYIPVEASMQYIHNIIRIYLFSYIVSRD